MLFNSFDFLLFIFLVLVSYWRVEKSSRWMVLLVASYFFYGSWNIVYLPLLMMTTLVNFILGLLVHGVKTHKKLILILGLSLNFGGLIVFKYLNFFTESIKSVFGLGGGFTVFDGFDWLLPVGISFYTFQAVSYLIDVYKGKVKPEKHLGYFSLYLAFFPNIASGPIARYSEVVPQFKKIKLFDYAMVVSGLKLFTLGLFKKMVIADNLAIPVNRVFDNLPEYKGFSLILAMVLFSGQIYADFSGYTDMARGIAKTLGIDLPHNFNFPFLATSLRDFWRRWHISLSSWFRDYLYIPLGGSRGVFARTCFNLLVVFGLCGLWHGAGWQFVVWGIFHGIVLSAERLGAIIIANRWKFPRIMTNIYAYMVVVISWVFFRSSNMSEAVYVLKNSLEGVKNFASPAYLGASLSQVFMTNKLEAYLALLLMGILLAMEILGSKKIFNNYFQKQHFLLRWGFYTLTLIIILHLRNAGITEFIYFQF